MFTSVRKIRLGIVVASMIYVALLAGCGSSQNESAPSSASPNPASASTASAPSASDPAASADPSDEGATRIVKTALGDVEIPAHPKRVVAGYYHGTLLALDFPVVGASKEWWMGSPFLKEREQSIGDIGSPPSLEKVLALDPDLIVIYDSNFEDYEALSKIAPTVYVPYDSTMGIREEVRLFAELFGREAEADAWFAKYEQEASKARERLKDIIGPDTTATLIHPNGQELAVLGDNFGRGGEAMYHAIGLKANERVQREVIDSGVQYQDISLELLPEYTDADIVFLCSWDGTTEEELKRVVDSGVWRQLPAVRDNRVIVLDYQTFFYFDPISVLGQIGALADELERHFAERS